MLPAARGGEVIDRIVATVNGHIILQSDWNEALSYEALLNGRPVAQFTDDDRRAVLDRLIDQELLRGQMKAADFQHATESEAVAFRWEPGAASSFICWWGSSVGSSGSCC